MSNPNSEILYTLSEAAEYGRVTRRSHLHRHSQGRIACPQK